MAENKDGLPKDAAPTNAAPKPAGPAPRPRNPVFRMMGLPNIRFKLPSRNWMIFLTITGSFTAAVVYDRQQKKRIQKKWCDLVAHIAQEPTPINRMPRRITIFLSAPPGDGIRSSRDYFREYVKPVLVSAAIDYDVIEGRKEGDVRYGTAEQIRRRRRKMGETGEPGKEPELDTQQAIEMVREKMYVSDEPGLQGDLVLGRHTWKEYIRGLHEGWLGPLDEPSPPPEPESALQTTPAVEPSSNSSEKINGDESFEGMATVHASEGEKKKDETEKKEEESEKEKKKPFPPSAYLPISSYESAPLSPYTPTIFEPSIPIHQQHILGFLKTPIRIYHFFNRRLLADEVGRQAAAIVLKSHRPYQQNQSFVSSSSSDPANENTIPLATKAPENDAAEIVQTQQIWEQQFPLVAEEPLWHKSIRKPKPKKAGEEDKSERIWMADMVIDPRIGERMRLFELDTAEEERANRIGSGQEKTMARPIENVRLEKVLVGNLDEDV